MKGLYLLILTSFFLIGCNSLLLRKEEISGLKYSKADENSYIYYTKKFELFDDGRMLVTTHSILRAGVNNKAAPDLIQVSDGSILKLINFEACLIKADGSRRKFGKSDLRTVNLSNNRVISESSIKFLPMEDYVSPGD